MELLCARTIAAFDAESLLPCVAREALFRDRHGFLLYLTKEVSSAQQKRAYVIADNRLTDASDWDDEMLRLELADLVEGGFEIALTGITEDELSKLSVGVGELEQMPELPDGDRSPFRDMTFILYGDQWGIVERAIARATAPREASNPNRSPQGNALAAICAEYLGRVA